MTRLQTMQVDVKCTTHNHPKVPVSLDTVPFDVLLRIASFLMPSYEEGRSLSYDWTFLLASNVLAFSCVSPSACMAVLTTLKQARLDSLDIEFFQTRNTPHPSDEVLFSATAAALHVINTANPIHLHLLRPHLMKKHHSISCFRYTAWHLLGVGNSPDLQLGEIIGQNRTTTTCLTVAEARLLTKVPLKWLALGSFRHYPKEQVYIVLKKLLKGFGGTLTDLWLFASEEAAHNAILDSLDSLTNLRQMRVATNKDTSPASGDPNMFLLRLLSGHHYKRISLKTLIAGDRQHLRFAQVEHTQVSGTIVQFAAMSFTPIHYIEARGISHIEFRIHELSFLAMEALARTALLPDLQNICIACNMFIVPEEQRYSRVSNVLDKITILQISEVLFPPVNDDAVYSLKNSDIAYIIRNCTNVQKFEARYELANVPMLGSLVSSLKLLKDFNVWELVPDTCLFLPPFTKSEVAVSKMIMKDVLKAETPLYRLSFTRIYVTADVYVEVLKRFGGSLNFLQLPLTTSTAMSSEESHEVELKYSDDDAIFVLRAIPIYCKRLRIINLSRGTPTDSSLNTGLLGEVASEVKASMRKKRGNKSLNIYL
eukprot:TRINITY_DN1118_c0_g1_i1.p1 TRINITY_DN1118_c0_g1~~TRINITY_DN1118_c0_g1_i1.p1  ORF type:complete len:596 (+),score=62.92 TRINITY_DN1118_c0_g1_i1:283-2070(+)